MRIAIGSDHAGFRHKEALIPWLESMGHEIQDYGTFSEESTDYPDYAMAVAWAVSMDRADRGILVCGSGIGVAITANKVVGIRAANCCSEEMARLARLHNNANILTFGGRLVSLELAKKMVEIFLTTPFEGGRHQRRVEKIHRLTGR